MPYDIMTNMVFKAKHEWIEVFTNSLELRAKNGKIFIAFNILGRANSKHCCIH